MDLIGCDRVQYEEHLQIECECGRTIKKHRMREGDEVVCLRCMARGKLVYRDEDGLPMIVNVTEG